MVFLKVFRTFKNVLLFPRPIEDVYIFVNQPCISRYKSCGTTVFHVKATVLVLCFEFGDRPVKVCYVMLKLDKR